MSCTNVNSGPAYPIYVAINGTNTDAFGRLRVSSPFTLFDSQNRYAIDNQFNTSTVTGDLQHIYQMKHLLAWI